jgi:glyoxylase-like metal-dependent hydrolase (beta-lactamase superfamily II)
MRIANGVEMLEISGSVRGMPRTIYPTLVWDAETTILVDAGFPGQLLLFRQAIEAAGVAFDRLDLLIVTHHDIDHIGGLASIRDALQGRLKIMAHAEEIL